VGTPVSTPVSLYTEEERKPRLVICLESDVYCLILFNVMETKISNGFCYYVFYHVDVFSMVMLCCHGFQLLYHYGMIQLHHNDIHYWFLYWSLYGVWIDRNVGICVVRYICVYMDCDTWFMLVFVLIITLMFICNVIHVCL
jgi:hypothetical protein